MGGGGGVGGRKLVGALRVVGVVTKKPVGISLASPTKGVGGYVCICLCVCIRNYVYVCTWLPAQSAHPTLAN